MSYRRVVCWVKNVGSETVDSEYAATVLAEYNGYYSFWNEACRSEGMEQALLKSELQLGAPATIGGLFNADDRRWLSDIKDTRRAPIDRRHACR